MTAERMTTGTMTVGERAAAPARAEPTPATAADPVVWTGPQDWQREKFTCVSIDQNFGQQMMAGVPSPVRPVIAASGLLARTTSGGTSCLHPEDADAMDVVVADAPGRDGTVADRLR